MTALGNRGKRISLDLTKWIEDARTDDLITGAEWELFLDCAATIAQVSKLFK